MPSILCEFWRWNIGLSAYSISTWPAEPSPQLPTSLLRNDLFLNKLSLLLLLAPWFYSHCSRGCPRVPLSTKLSQRPFLCSTDLLVSESSLKAGAHLQCLWPTCHTNSGKKSDLTGLESASSLQTMVCNGRLPGTDRPKSSNWIFCLFIYFRPAHRHSWLHLPSQSLLATQAAGFLALSANALPSGVCCIVALLVVQK